MSTIAQEQKADLGDIDQVDRIELHVAECEVECALADDTRGLAQIFLHKTRGAQMRPGETGPLEMFLNLLMHETKWECGFRPCVQTRKFDHVAHACRLASVYKNALRFGHI